MKKLYFTRHGETEWNAERRIQGKLDSPLTELGEAQARALGARLAYLPIEVIYVSPLTRARETARLMNLSARVVVDERLSEMSLGDMEGMTGAQAAHYFPAVYDDFRNHPDVFQPVGEGENFRMLISRARDFLREISERREQRVLAVTHLLAMCAFHSAIARTPLRDMMKPAVPACAFNQATFDARWALDVFGDLHHEAGWDALYYGSRQSRLALAAGELVTPIPDLARAQALGDIRMEETGEFALPERDDAFFYRLPESAMREAVPVLDGAQPDGYWYRLNKRMPIYQE